MNNKYRQFLSMGRLESQKANAKLGELVNPYNKYVLSQNEIDAYNKYTSDFNRENCRARQELLLDNRHKFFVSCGDNFPINKGEF